MGFIRLRTTTSAALRKARLLARALTPTAQDLVTRRVAWIWHARMVLRTPKRWTGATRRAWKVAPISIGRATGFRVSNSTKVMGYLERGTRAHGPVNAKFLFIPLTRRAAEAGARVVLGTQQAGRRRFVYGRDFVLTKRVRGIRAMWIARDAKPFMRTTYKQAMIQFILEVLRQ